MNYFYNPLVNPPDNLNPNQVPCDAKEGYVRVAYPQLTHCCSKCCSTYNDKQHVMSIKANKCYEGIPSDTEI